MKKIVLAFLILTGTIALLTSCKKDEDPEPRIVINGFTPESGIEGETVTISGENFSTTANENIVMFNGVATAVSNATAGSITVTVPKGATTGKISVTVNGVTAESTNEFEVLFIPIISGFTPESGIEDETVTISGENFSTTASENIVMFNGVATAVSNATAGSITVTVPEGATTGKISVTVKGVTAESTNEFEVIFAPVISGFTPESGIEGETVTISGENFSSTANENIVKFNGVTATVNNATESLLSVTVPEGATTGKISVTVNNLMVESTNEFAIEAPIISRFTPTQGIAGTIVLIEGNYFSELAGKTTVKFNGLDATVFGVTSTSIAVIAPENVSTGKITVSVNALTTTSTEDFTLMGNDERVNYALTAVTRASSTFTGYSPSYVNDGAQDIDDHKKSWTNVDGASTSNPQWIELDFGEVKTFRHIEIYTPTGHEVRDFEIQYFNSEEMEWVKASSMIDNYSSNITFFFHELVSDKVRLVATKGSPYQPSYTRITEFEVWNY